VKEGDAPFVPPAPKEMKSPEPIFHRERIETEAIDLTNVGISDAPKTEPSESMRVSRIEPAAAPEMEPEIEMQTPPPAPVRVSRLEPQPEAQPEIRVHPQPRKADPDMLRKISELEGKIQTLQKENQDLAADIEASTRTQRDEALSISSENWNLERATMRYNEAERELKRMGQQLQQERAHCDLQKQDLEAQLFDPQLTTQQQLARLGELEARLAEAELKNAEYEAQMRSGKH
jgi:hypothetical protein